MSEGANREELTSYARQGCNINISVNFLVKHVEMQEDVHFTIVCAILLIDFKKTWKWTMYVNPCNKILYESE